MLGVMRIQGGIIRGWRENARLSPRKSSGSFIFVG